MEHRYSALRIAALVYKILGIVTLVVTLAIVLVLLGSLVFGTGIPLMSRGAERQLESVFGRIGITTVALGVIIFYGGGASLTLFAFGQLIELMIALEENTRATALYLKQQSREVAAARQSATHEKNWLSKKE